MDTLYINDEKKDEEEVEEEVQHRRKSFPAIVDKVIKVIHLGLGLGEELSQVKEIDEHDGNPKEETADEEMKEDVEDSTEVEEKKPEAMEEAPVKLTDEELKQKMKASLGFLIEQQALGQLEDGK